MDKKTKEWIKKTWYFVWESDSVWSLLLDIVLAFVLIKFILYPGIGFIFSTTYPIVAVVSGSMEHMIVEGERSTPTICGNSFEKNDYFVNFDEYWDLCGAWYETEQTFFVDKTIKITKKEFSKFQFKNGFNKGDIIFIYGTNPKNLKIGDVIVFVTKSRNYPIIHRIISIDDSGEQKLFFTKGDHNPSVGSLDKNIQEETILGKGVFRIPYLGWIKIWFVDLLNFIKR